MGIELVVDSREQTLLEDARSMLNDIAIKTEMLTLGDLLIRTCEGEVLFMIERKSVRDLMQSLRDGRHHDQKKRWIEFKQDNPQANVALWLEGDLMTTTMEEMLRSSLLNSLFRMQSKHGILVHQVRTRDAFMHSLRLTVGKLRQDPCHLVPSEKKKNVESTITDMPRYRKSAHSNENYWQDCLALIPGVSMAIANKIKEEFPIMSLFFQCEQAGLQKRLEEIAINNKRRLGNKLATRIIQHLFFRPDNREEEIKK